jgi:hypothetical protein
MSDAKTVEAADPTKKTSEITGPVDDDATVLTNTSIKCYWNNEEFDSGDRVTSEGKSYECSNGKWVEV